MLMQMLAAGGVPILSDGLRQPDEDNPNGYLEFEPVKALRKQADWLLECRGKAVKIIAPLLDALPAELPCKIILMERDLDEVLDSQERMLSRAQKDLPHPPGHRDILKREYAKTLARVKSMLAARPETEVLVFDYRDVLHHPARIAENIAAFLPFDLKTESMANVVDQRLYRNRT